MLKKLHPLKAAFTLMEVNLAVFVMATGVLAVVVLYPLGFRENQQSREDVAAAVLADAALNPLVAALSSPKMKWSEWEKLFLQNEHGKIVPNNGWAGYCRDSTHFIPMSRNALQSTTDTTLSTILGAYTRSCSSSSGNPIGDAQQALKKLDDMGYALVVTTALRWEDDENGKLSSMVADPSRLCIGFRATRKPNGLFAQPLFYTEVCFQGDPNQ